MLIFVNCSPKMKNKSNHNISEKVKNRNGWIEVRPKSMAVIIKNHFPMMARFQTKINSDRTFVRSKWFVDLKFTPRHFWSDASGYRACDQTMSYRQNLWSDLFVCKWVLSRLYRDCCLDFFPTNFSQTTLLERAMPRCALEDWLIRGNFRLWSGIST